MVEAQLGTCKELVSQVGVLGGRGVIWREKGPAQLWMAGSGAVRKTSGLEPLQVSTGDTSQALGRKRVNLDLEPEPPEVGSRGPSLSWACGPVGLVTGTEPAPGPFGESKGEGPG